MLRRITAVFFASVFALWAFSGGARARDQRPGLYITPNGYEVPVYGMSLVRHADGRLGTACARLTQEQIESARLARSTSRAMLAATPRVSVRSAAGVTFSIAYTDAPGQGFGDPEQGAQRRAALEASMAAWSATIQGTVPIVVQARMEDQSETSLAHAGPVDFVPINGRLMPYSLAAQLTNSSVNKGTADIEAVFNQKAQWDYAPNGVNAADKVSFVYTAIHEVCHGLGFLDTFDPDTGLLSPGIPTPYDAFVNRGGGSNPVMSRAPDDVKADLISNDLFFAGPASIQASLGSIRPLPMVKLYAPSPYEKGSSISHVDQDTYADIRVGMMTPRDFGPGSDKIDVLTLGIMADVGYQLVPGGPRP